MATDYTTVCDFCGLTLTSKSDDVAFKKGSWRVSVDNHWLEAIKGSENSLMVSEIELDRDACSECAKKVANLIKTIKPNP